LPSVTKYFYFDGDIRPCIRRGGVIAAETEPKTQTLHTEENTMAGPNYEKMTVKDLLDHQTRIQKALAGAKDREMANAREDIATMLSKRGLSIEDLMGGKRAGKGGKGGKVAPKYRNPENPAETWTGRGRQPRWLVAKLGRGGKINDFRI
jgi:DNA-binding protein H-NS